MNVAVVDSGGDLVAFQRMDGAMLRLNSDSGAQGGKQPRPSGGTRPRFSRTASSLMHLNYLLAFEELFALAVGIPLIEQGAIIGAVGCSGGRSRQTIRRNHDNCKRSARNPLRKKIPLQQ